MVLSVIRRWEVSLITKKRMSLYLPPPRLGGGKQNNGRFCEGMQVILTSKRGNLQISARATIVTRNLGEAPIGYTTAWCR